MLDGITFTDIRQELSADEPITGMQTGCPIVVKGDAVTSAVIQNCTVVDFQKQAVTIDAQNAKALIDNNTITGVGPTTVTAQNAVVIWSCGADSVVSGNQISELCYTGNSTATGIMSCEGAEFTAEGNTLHNVQKTDRVL